MKTYEITIECTMSETFHVKAESEEKALDIIEAGDENSTSINENYFDSEVMECIEIK